MISEHFQRLRFLQKKGNKIKEKPLVYQYKSIINHHYLQKSFVTMEREQINLLCIDLLC